VLDVVYVAVSYDFFKQNLENKLHCVYELEFLLGYSYHNVLNGIQKVDSGVVISDKGTLIYRFMQI
jgi:hypothetical protein